MTMKKSRGKGRLAEIAARCGISARVVAAVLSPHGAGTVGFSGATRRKVEAEARKAGYQGNRTARWLGRGRHGSIGVISSSTYLIPSPMMDGFLTAARQRGLFLVFDRALPGEASMFLGEHCVDGLIAFDDLRATDRRRITQMSLPTLWVNTNRHRGPNVITYDERSAARLAVEHLREQGWTRPMALDFDGNSHYSATERRAGAQDAARGMPVFLSRATATASEEVVDQRAKELESFLAANPGVNGAVAFNPWLVAPLYEALSRCGRKPGANFGVVTFGRYGPSRSVFPQVTTLTFDETALGRRIVELLEDLIEKRGAADLPLRVSYQLIVRGSTRKDENHDEMH